MPICMPSVPEVRGECQAEVQLPSVFDQDIFSPFADWDELYAQDAARAEAWEAYEADRAAAEWYSTARVGQVLAGMGLTSYFE